MIGLGLVFSGCGPATGPLAAAPTPTPNTLDLSRWTVTTLGTGPTATEGNGGVVLAIPAKATLDAQRHLTSINLVSNCKLTGDFDLQLDYSLVTWPARNSVRLGLVAGSYSVERSSNLPPVMDNLYATNLAGVQASVETHDSTGRLRLTRVGPSVTGYYRSNATWARIASEKAVSDPLSYSIAAWTDYNAVVKSDVSVTVKNFTVTSHSPCS